ncbi:MAG: NAD(P)-dependent alcohol dehydrogenase [Saprospiraceae bacterium]|nr:NAD(P)-dependent alcohol dehydrogenase [Saprospiraceae bacterium]
MQAVIYEKYGPPSVLKIKTIEKPVPKDNEVLIRVYATTVNRTDCAILRAKPFIMRFGMGLLRPKKPIGGTDFSGKIEAVGKAVTSFKAGDQVFGFNDMGLSSHAEYMTLGEDKALATMPENISYEEAAASLEGAHYAYNMINKTTLKSGQKVLVNGAAGTIGSAAVQLSKYFGAEVTAVGNTKNMELMKSLGADQVIDYLKEDFTKSNEKYDYVFDAVGKSSFNKCKPLLNPRGVYISSELGWMLQNLFLPLITPVFGGKKVIFPIPSDCKRSVLLVKKMTEEGRYKAVIDRKYPLENIAEAYTYVETGEKTGNVVIDCLFFP